jgi:hypothetical protein
MIPMSNRMASTIFAMAMLASVQIEREVKAELLPELEPEPREPEPREPEPREPEPREPEPRETPMPNEELAQESMKRASHVLRMPEEAASELIAEATKHARIDMAKAMSRALDREREERLRFEARKTRRAPRIGDPDPNLAKIHVPDPSEHAKGRPHLTRRARKAEREKSRTDGHAPPMSRRL